MEHKASAVVIHLTVVGRIGTISGEERNSSHGHQSTTAATKVAGDLEKMRSVMALIHVWRLSRYVNAHFSCFIILQHAIVFVLFGFFSRKIMKSTTCKVHHPVEHDLCYGSVYNVCLWFICSPLRRPASNPSSNHFHIINSSILDTDNLMGLLMMDEDWLTFCFCYQYVLMIQGEQSRRSPSCTQCIDPHLPIVAFWNCQQGDTERLGNKYGSLHSTAQFILKNN